MPDNNTPALPPLPDLERLDKRLNAATPDDLQPYERPDISVSCALALIAHVRALQAENERLREALEIIAGERQCIDNLMSHSEVARAAVAASRREG